MHAHNLLIAVLAACVLGKPEDAGQDTAVLTDSGTADTSDTAPLPDTAGTDTSETDTEETDSGVPDSADSAPPDTGRDTSAPSADADGDGYSPEDGDCDDADPDTHPGAIEVLNGTDDDCDGETDVVQAGADADAWLEATTGANLGYRGLSVGDLDADGLPEVIAAAPALMGTADAQVYVLEGADYATFAGDPGAYAETTLSTEARFGFVGERMGDVDGDGVDDLAAIGWYGGPALLVYEGPLAPGTLTEADADLTLDAASGALEGAILSDADPDGDGACGLVFGDPAAAEVRVWTGDPGSGVVDPSAADVVWTGRAGVGRALAAGDLDGDGADDVAVADYTAGVVYVLPASAVRSSGDAATLAQWTFTLQTNVGMYGGLAFGSVDPDGGVDLVVGEPFAPANTRAVDGGRVEVFFGGLGPGTYTFSDADVVVEGEGMGTIFDFGHHVGVADPFGDGPLVLASAPVAGSPPSWLFGYDAATATLWSDHTLAIEGATPGDGLGHRFAVEDLDLDGAPEWIVAAPDAYSIGAGGALWFFAGR